MKIIILAIGKEKDFSGLDLVHEYTKRISHYTSCEWKFIPSSGVVQENREIIEAITHAGTGTYTIALDEKGKEYDSAGFSEEIQSRMNESVRTLFFVIGGSYGLSEEVRQKADRVVALSKLTFPHQLVRLILVEQLYRAFTIIKGEKYHH